MKIRLQKDFFEKHNNINESDLELLEIKKQLDCNKRGFIKINDIYLSYSYIVTTDENITYYVNFENGNGPYRATISELIGTISRLGGRTLNDVLDIINRHGFKHKVMQYKDNENVINFIYIFNKKYYDMFENDNELQ